MRLTAATIFLLGALALAPTRAYSQAPANNSSTSGTGSPAPGQDPARHATHKPEAGVAASKAKPVKLGEVVVTATRIKQPLSQIGTSVSVMPGGQMQDQKLGLIAPAMQQLPGVEVNQAGSPGTQTDVTIRGSTSAQTLILVDGVDVNTVSTGAFDFSTLTTDNIEQVEVVRGSGGALYGSQAIGGVVNVISKQGQGAPHFSLLSEGGNRGTERQVFTANGAQGNFAYSGSISYQSTEGFRPVNDSSDNLSGALRLDYRLGSNTIVRGFARYIRSNVDLVNFSNSVGELLDPNAHQRGEFLLFKGEVEHNFTDRLWAKWSGFFVRDEIRLNNYPESANPTFEVDDIPDENRATNTDVVYTWDWGRTLAGFDFHDQWARIRNEEVNPFFNVSSDFHHERQEYAGYMQQEETLPGAVATITGGFRVDGDSDFGEEVSPAWAVVIPIKRLGAALRGSYSEGFRAPSFDELFFPGFGNPNLGPEISSEYDAGISKNFGEVATVGVIYFTRRIHNLIVPVPCTVGPNCPFGSEAGNAGRVDTQGVEFIPVLSPWHGIGLSGNFTYLDETHRSEQSSSVPLRTPKYSASATLHYARSELLRATDALSADLIYVFVGDRDDVSPKGTILDNAAYNRFDFTVNYSPGLQWKLLSREQVYVRVQNLFDRRYQSSLGFKSPPINFVAGITMGF
ncbi:MAG TPA: TonB-dependent receptor [Candidatus Binataceae bacterium]|nr:TonB-dependent receptor [Candidatus Binataceae bacterium]